MEEVEQLICKHVVFQKVLALQDEKVMGSGSPEHDGGGGPQEGYSGWVYAQKQRWFLCLWKQGWKCFYGSRISPGCPTLRGPQGAFTEREVALAIARATSQSLAVQS